MFLSYMYMTNGSGFTDELLTSVLADDILSFDQEDFVEDVSKFRAQNSFLELACYLTGSSFFQLELKANISTCVSKGRPFSEQRTSRQNADVFLTVLPAPGSSGNL